jgi:hypothetical protein
MVRKFGSNPQEQMQLERRRFVARQRPKPVLADKIKARDLRELKRHRERQEEGNEKIFRVDLY